MKSPLNRRRFLLQTAGATLALPGLPSLLAKTTESLATLQATAGAGVGAQRFVAVGNLLGFQQKSFFPQTTGRGWEATTLLKPLEAMRKHMTVYRGLDHGVRGGHFAVHSFLSGVLNSEARDRPDGNVTIDQFLAEDSDISGRLDAQCHPVSRDFNDLNPYAVVQYHGFGSLHS